MKVITDKYGIEHMLIANEGADEETIEKMLDMAALYYYGYKDALNTEEGETYDIGTPEDVANMDWGAFDATAGCISLMVGQPRSNVEDYVKALACEKYGM